jgi:hypothetical protein
MEHCREGECPIGRFKSGAAPSRGLGDTVAKVLRKVGVKPCPPCDKRKAWLNRLRPSAPSAPTESSS